MALPLHEFIKDMLSTHLDPRMQAHVDIIVDNARTGTESERQLAIQTLTKRNKRRPKMLLDVSDHTKKESRWDSSPPASHPSPSRRLHITNSLLSVRQKSIVPDNAIDFSDPLGPSWRSHTLDISPSHSFEESTAYHLEQVLLVCSDSE